VVRLHGRGPRDEQERDLSIAGARKRRVSRRSDQRAPVALVGRAPAAHFSFMYLVQLLLPLHHTNGQAVPHSLFERVRDELTHSFGGVTAYLRAPAQGLWRDDAGAVEPDEIVIVEVMCDALDRAFWSQYREGLARELGQQELVVRALPMQSL
jgi:hypothetical protein